MSAIVATLDAVFVVVLFTFVVVVVCFLLFVSGICCCLLVLWTSGLFFSFCRSGTGGIGWFLRVFQLLELLKLMLPPALLRPGIYRFSGCASKFSPQLLIGYYASRVAVHVQGFVL